MKKKGMPREGEVVICRITSLNPNSAFAVMEEYGKEGMIHVSEVASRWVRDIREFVRENQLVVCRVMKIEGDHVSLSIKRVSKEEASSRLNEFKRENKSEKFLEVVAKQKGATLEKAYEEAGGDLVESFGSLTKAFDVASKNPEMLAKRGIRKDWAEAICDALAKSKAEKSYEVKAVLEIVCYKPNGAEVIKEILSKVPKGCEVRYISAPKYMITKKGSDRKEIEIELSRLSASLIEAIRKSDGHGKFSIVQD
jgi:translation initiation factor 2 subunit 1